MDEKKLVMEYLKKAYEKLKAAEILLENDLLPDAVSRAYYAAFTAVRALLLALGEEPKTHRGVQRLFGMLVISKNLLPKEYGRYYAELLASRELADYDVGYPFAKEWAQDLINKAKMLVNAISKLLEKLLKNKPNSNLAPY